MTKEELKIWIKDNLYTKRGINPNSSRISWWKNKGIEKIYNQIIEETSFLDPQEKYLYQARIYCILNDIIKHPKCICGKNVYFEVHSKFNQFCSIKCAAINLVNKRKNTCLEKYGVDNPNKLKEVREKYKQTCLEKYGSKNSSQSHISKESLDKLNNKDWLYEQHVNKKKSHKEISKELRVVKSTVSKKCREFEIETQYFYTSLEQKEVTDYIKSILSYNIIENSRSIISPIELDIYIPDKNLAIEFNGLFWHSCKNKSYHLYKTLECEKIGIQLLHIFENEWLLKQDIVKSIIAAKLEVYQETIFARKCIIKELKSSETREFLNQNHLQGYAPAKVNIGLYYNEELVSLMTFSKPRFSRKYEYELVRFANKLNTKVIGGASKIFKYFIENYNPNSIITYADRRYSNGNLYKVLGFGFKHSSEPNYWYSKNNSFILESRIKYQKHKLHKLLDNFDPNKTEQENMLENGYIIIYDCGNLVFEYLK